jgi:hypothetical protein
MSNYIQGSLYRWKLPEKYIDQVYEISCKLNISEHITHLLFERGYKSVDHIRDFLFPLYDEQKYCATHLLGAQKAVERILKAIEKQDDALIEDLRVYWADEVGGMVKVTIEGVE